MKQDFIRTVTDFDLTGHRNTLSEILSMSSMLLLIQKTSLYGRLKEILKGVLTISTTESCYRRYGVLESTIKDVIKIIQQMLKAGYIESGARNDTKLGTMQGGILSPLLSNVYLNDFDWYVGRMYMEPHRKCKHKCNDTRRLKWLDNDKVQFSFCR